MSAQGSTVDPRVGMIAELFCSTNEEAKAMMIGFAQLQVKSFPAHPKTILTLVHSAPVSIEVSK